MHINKLLYFTLSQDTLDEFIHFVQSKRYAYEFSFRLLSDEAGKHTSDLLFLLNKFENEMDLNHTFVIIDYISFLKYDEKVYDSDEDGYDSLKNSSNTIRRAILKYPEVFFMFDETGLTEEGDNRHFNYLTFLFNGLSPCPSVYKQYHLFDAKAKEPFIVFSSGRDNLFDGSNLRLALKRYLYDDLKVTSYNFSLSQDSRGGHLALCVEEEHSQNRFNSYSLYANGFRVLPVESSTGLKNINEEVKDHHIPEPSIIVRDFDLQFSDVKGGVLYEVIDDEKCEINQIDYIRGVKFYSSDNLADAIPPRYMNKWHVPTGDPGYWTALNSISTVFVSKGVAEIEMYSTEALYKENRGRNITDSLFVDEQDKQVLYGIEKPVSGIYLPIQSFSIVKSRFNHILIESFVIEQAYRLSEKCGVLEDKKQLSSFIDRKYGALLKSRTSLKKKINSIITSSNLTGDKLDYGKDILEPEEKTKSQGWFIETSREHHNHGVPLDVYDLVKSMLARATGYYKHEKYIRSAIIASDVLEILNGFHEALGLQAYHILSISENAISMNTIGGSENLLKRDAEFRIAKIENDIDRFLARSDKNKDRREFKYNILNQIFSDCRNFCKDKEHFEAENCFISAMAHNNEGYVYDDIKHEIVSMLKRMKDSWYAINHDSK